MNFQRLQRHHPESENLLTGHDMKRASNTSRGHENYKLMNEKWKVWWSNKVCLFLSFLWHIHSITFHDYSLICLYHLYYTLTHTHISSSLLHQYYIFHHFITDAICHSLYINHCVSGCHPVVYIELVQVVSSLLWPLVYLVIIGIHWSSSHSQHITVLQLLSLDRKYNVYT